MKHYGDGSDDDGCGTINDDDNGLDDDDNDGDGDTCDEIWWLCDYEGRDDVADTEIGRHGSGSLLPKQY